MTGVWRGHCEVDISMGGLPTYVVDVGTCARYNDDINA